jgi:hypothetical protein
VNSDSDLECICKVIKLDNMEDNIVGSIVLRT